MREELLRSTKLFADETTATVLDPGRGRTKKGCFWALARDDRPTAHSAHLARFRDHLRRSFGADTVKTHCGVVGRAVI
jgi:hypothetical protein